MVDPVVSSRFGSRPLLDIPAMQVSSTSHREIPSLQNPVVPPLRLDTYGPGFHRAGDVIPRSYHTAPPPEPFNYDPYRPREYNHYYGPHGEVVKPTPYHLHPMDKYPGVHMPYTSYHHAPPPLPPAAPAPLFHPAPVHVPLHPYHSRVPAHYHGPRPQTFDVTCELDYGRVAHISVRESHGHFRGIPEYIRQELMKTYGKYPFMEVKIRFENGEYHIYANHDKRQLRRDRDDRPRNRYYEEENDYEDDRSDQRHDDEMESQTDAIRPREMGAPRGILRERGWNSYR